MAEKRYAIVRVDHSYCPIIEEYTKGCYCPQDKDRDFYCSDCKTFKNYGDTKEQLIRKVVQIVSKQLRLVSEEDFFKFAKELIEFLGVE